MNRFLLCTLICEAARAIKARAAQNGPGASVTVIARDLLRSYLMGAASQPEAPLEPDPGVSALWQNNGTLNEDEMFRTIDLQLQSVLSQTRTWRAEERRLDMESIATALEARRKR